MKKIMTLVAAMAMTATISASNNNANITINEPVSLAPFSKVNVNVPARIRIVSGEEYGVVANTAHTQDLAELDFHVRDGVLYISTESMDMLSASGRGTIITVITPLHDTGIQMGDKVQPLRRQ